MFEKYKLLFFYFLMAKYLAVNLPYIAIEFIYLEKEKNCEKKYKSFLLYTYLFSFN